MNLDTQLLFFGSSPYQSVSDFTSLVGTTGSGITSSTIDLGVAMDMGIGDGEAIPKLALYIGTGVTSSSASLTLNVQFQGSTNSTTWTTYAESGAATTASYAAGAKVFPIDVPHRSAGAALPRYYRINLDVGTAGSTAISTGSIFGGIVLQRTDNPGGLYPSGFVVV